MVNITASDGYSLAYRSLLSCNARHGPWINVVLGSNIANGQSPWPARRGWGVSSSADSHG